MGCTSMLCAKSCMVEPFFRKSDDIKFELNAEQRLYCIDMEQNEIHRITARVTPPHTHTRQFN